MSTCKNFGIIGAVIGVTAGGLIGFLASHAMVESGMITEEQRPLVVLGFAGGLGLALGAGTYMWCSIGKVALKEIKEIVKK